MAQLAMTGAFAWNMGGVSYSGANGTNILVSYSSLADYPAKLAVSSSTGANPTYISMYIVVLADIGGTGYWCNNTGYTSAWSDSGSSTTTSINARANYCIAKKPWLSTFGGSMDMGISSLTANVQVPPATQSVSVWLGVYSDQTGGGGFTNLYVAYSQPRSCTTVTVLKR